MKIQEMLGDAYKDGMTIDEINDALSTRKFADLSTGDYVDRNKYNADLKSKNDELNTIRGKLNEKLTDSEKADESIKADKARIKELEDFIKKQTVSSNRDKAQSLTSDIRTILGFEDTDEGYGNLLDSLANGETENTRSLATYINKIVKESYEKGKKDATKDSLGNFGNGVDKQSSGKQDDVGSFGKSLAAQSKPTIDPNMFFSNK